MLSFGLAGIKRIVVTVFFVVNSVVVGGLLLTGYSYLIDPAVVRYAAPLGLLFPAFLVANAVCLVLWLLLAVWRVWLPIVGFLLCYTPLTMYFAMHPTASIPDDAITIMSYNVHDFAGTETAPQEKYDNAIVPYILSHDADIVCLQECSPDKLCDSLFATLYAHYPYHHYSSQGKALTSLSVYSKYPIQKVDSIACDTIANISVAYTILLPRGTVMVVNNHFESNKFTPEKKKEWRGLMKGELATDSAKVESKYIFARFTEMALRRNKQMKAVEAYLSLYDDVPTIVCGDFNEIPLSYNHHLLARHYNDCFRTTGWGCGWTYCNHGMRVRIDNILCSPHLVPYRCRVLKDEKLSDHYPVVCYLNFPPPPPRDE